MEVNKTHFYYYLYLFDLYLYLFDVILFPEKNFVQTAKKYQSLRDDIAKLICKWFAGRLVILI